MSYTDAGFGCGDHGAGFEVLAILVHLTPRMSGGRGTGKCDPFRVCVITLVHPWQRAPLGAQVLKKEMPTLRSALQVSAILERGLAQSATLRFASCILSRLCRRSPLCASPIPCQTGKRRQGEIPREARNDSTPRQIKGARTAEGAFALRGEDQAMPGCFTAFSMTGGESDVPRAPTRERPGTHKGCPYKWVGGRGRGEHNFKLCVKRREKSVLARGSTIYVWVRRRRKGSRRRFAHKNFSEGREEEMSGRSEGTWCAAAGARFCG